MARVHITIAQARGPAYHVSPGCGHGMRIKQGRIVELADLDFDFYRWQVTPCGSCGRIVSCTTCGSLWSDFVHYALGQSNPKFHRPTGTTLYDKAWRGTLAERERKVSLAG